MKKFNQRTSKPGAGNKCYITRGRGGWSWCIQGYPTDANCDVLSNCVGYSCGRFNEIYNAITGYQGMKYYALNCNAEGFVNRAKSIGLEVVNYPVLGGIMVWQAGATLDGSDGAGHVETVEDIYDGNNIYTSASNYAGTAFYNARRSNSNGRWGLGSSYRFLGCIVNPAIGKVTERNQDEPKPEPTPTPTSYKFNIGDKVVIDGALYVNSNAEKATGHVSNKITTITRRAEGARHPYNTSGDLGWMDEKDIKAYTEESSKDVPFRVGDKVVPTKLVDYNGTHLRQYDPYYVISQISGDRAVLMARGQIWAAMNTANIKHYD